MKVIGLCGRPGTGKSTVAEIIAKYEPPTLYHFTKPEEYISQVIFGNATETSIAIIKELLLEYTLSKDFMAPSPEFESGSDYVEMSFSQPLKHICIPILNVSYDEIYGREKREDRELNLRFHLQKIGTEIFRNMDPLIWVKIAEHRIQEALYAGKAVVLSDVRFPNELEMLRRCGGKLAVIYKDEDDLIITEDDRKDHISRWGFLEFSADFDYKIKNNGSILDLKKMVDETLMS